MLTLGLWRECLARLNVKPVNRLSAVLAAASLALLAGMPAVSASYIPPGGAADSAGTNIGNAAPLTTTATGTIVNGSDDWWVIYPATAGKSVTVNVANTTASGTGCAGIVASLDGANGASDSVASETLGPASFGPLTGSAPGSSRYFVEVSPGNCASVAGYTLTLTAGGGGTAPTPKKVPVVPGTSIGNAWPPLQGHTYDTATLGTVSNDDWYTLYKKSDTTSATIRIQSDTVSGAACGNFEIHLDGTDGSAGNISSNTVFDNGALTLSIPGSESGDPQGRYYLEVTPNPFSNGCGPGASYSIEPEPAAQWTSPVRVPSSAASPGTTVGNVSAPLQGGTSHTQTLGTVSNDDWYVLYKEPDSASGTIRVTNTTVAGSACGNFLLNEDGSDGSGANISSNVIGDNTAATFTVPGMETGDPQGRYYLEIAPDPFSSGCGAGASYSIEPEPAAQWSSPAQLTTAPMPSGPTMKAAGGPLAGNTRYNGSLGTSSSADWVYFHINGSQQVTARVEDTTESDNNCVNVNFALQNSGTTLNSGQIGDNSAANTVLTQAGNYFAEVTVAGSCVPTKPLTADVSLTPGAGVTGPALKVSSTTLPNATVGKVYSATIAVTGGKPPDTFTAESALPAGLKLNATTGVISGTPAKRDTFTFSVKIIDSATPIANVITDQFTITIK